MFHHGPVRAFGGAGTGTVRPHDVRRMDGTWLAAAGPNACRDAHIEHIYGKIGVSSRVQLASWLRTWPPMDE